MILEPRKKNVNKQLKFSFKDFNSRDEDDKLITIREPNESTNYMILRPIITICESHESNNK